MKAVVGANRWKENRCKKPLSEWFTVTDEAFLLVVLEGYWKHWEYDWLCSNAGRPASNETEIAQDIQPLYTVTATNGSKKNWSIEGLECFNNLAVMVHNDRLVRGQPFDDWFLDNDSKV